MNALTWVDCFGAFSIVWGFLVAVLIADWLMSTYHNLRG